MDGYPDHLAPEIEESGAIKTPFEEWWNRVHTAFPNVPEDVARQWLHRHWGLSPYSWIRSRNYKFVRTSRPAEWLRNVVTPVNRGGYQANLRRGEDKVNNGNFWLRTYMLENRKFPVPIIVLDNRDGHLLIDAPEWEPVLPGWVLIEGHNRFELALFLEKSGAFSPTVDVWLMECVTENGASN